MATHVERFPAKHVPTKAWIGIGAAIVLLMTIGGGILIGRATVEEPAPPPEPVATAPPPEPMATAPDKFVATIDANIAALNAGDEQAYAATWGEGGEFGEWGTDFESYWEERSAIQVGTQPGPGVRIERTSDVIFVPRISSTARVYTNGPYAAHTFSCGAGELSYSGIAVYRFSGSKIIGQSVISPSRKWLPACY